MKFTKAFLTLLAIHNCNAKGGNVVAKNDDTDLSEVSDVSATEMEINFSTLGFNVQFSHTSIDYLGKNLHIVHHACFFFAFAVILDGFFVQNF